MEPAASIIRLFGGAQAVAAIVHKHPSRVYRWTYAESTREGGGGLVPSRDQRRLLEYAEANAIDLRPEDFFSATRLIEVLGPAGRTAGAVSAVAQ